MGRTHKVEPLTCHLAHRRNTWFPSSRETTDAWVMAFEFTTAFASTISATLNLNSVQGPVADPANQSEEPFGPWSSRTKSAIERITHYPIDLNARTVGKGSRGVHICSDALTVWSIDRGRSKLYQRISLRRGPQRMK